MWQTTCGKCIYTSASGYRVYQNWFYRWLTLGSPALQTVINRRTPTKPILYYLSALSLMARNAPSDVCMLGLGGGGIVHLLAGNGDFNLYAVDISAEVIHIAERFFFLDCIPNLKIIQSDAIDFLADSEQLYPHLIVDLYDAHQFPPGFKQDDFFILCKQRVTNDGFLSVNIANINEHRPLLELIKKQFASTLVIPVKNSANLVVIATQKDSEWLLEKVRQTGELKQIMWVDSWGLVGS